MDPSSRINPAESRETGAVFIFATPSCNDAMLEVSGSLKSFEPSIELSLNFYIVKISAMVEETKEAPQIRRDSFVSSAIRNLHNLEIERQLDARFEGLGHAGDFEHRIIAKWRCKDEYYLSFSGICWIDPTTRIHYPSILLSRGPGQMTVKPVEPS